MQWAQSCWDQCSGVMVGAWCPVVLHTMGSCAPQTAAAELAGNNRCCLSQSLMSEVYIIASLIFLEGCIESSAMDIELLGKSTGCLRMLMRSTESEMSIGALLLITSLCFVSFAHVTGMGSAALELWRWTCGLSRLPRSQ